MSRIIKEPFALRTHHFTLDQIGVRSVRSFYQRSLRSALTAVMLMRHLRGFFYGGPVSLFTTYQSAFPWLLL